MRKIPTPTPGPTYDEALKKAQELKDAHLQEFENDPTADIKISKHYQVFKKLLLENQFDKCAYCESPIHNQPGDVEHYRPKSRVTELDGRAVELKIDDKDATTRHPGYFWLAYDIDNLLMACADCNRARYHTNKEFERPVRAGKADCFPVSGSRAFRPNDPLDQEKPLLLNPLVDDPAEHLELDSATGLFMAKSRRGEETIKLLGLNKRENLRNSRFDACLEAESLIANFIDAKSNSNERAIAKFEKEIYDLEKERSRYFLAQRLGWQATAGKLDHSIVDAIVNAILRVYESPPPNQ